VPPIFGRATITWALAHIRVEFGFTFADGSKILQNWKCGPMPNLMVALPRIGGAVCSTPQSLADAHYWNAVQ